MNVDAMKKISYDQLRALYKEFLRRQNVSKATIDTAYSDTFYLWRNGSKELFWNTIQDTEFEENAKTVMIKILSEKSTGNANALASGYLSHLRRFRKFLLWDGSATSTDGKQRSTLQHIVRKPRNAKTLKSGREIIINKMYTGSYLLDGKNIGHEIINLYKADDGKNYIYLNALGTIGLSHQNNTITVLLTRRYGMKTYKVLAKAEDITIFDFVDTAIPREQRYKQQLALGITYGGVPLEKLFDSNLYHGSIQDDKNVYTTFIAQRVIKPKEQLYITDDESVVGDNIFFIRTNKGFGKQTLREYYHEKEKPKSFYDLSKIIENEDLWESKNTTRTVSELRGLQRDLHFNFLNIIRQEDNELAFSNMFAYFFSLNRNVFLQFANEVLNVEMQKDFSIEREKHHIDLLLIDSKNVIIIENKIKSGINGVDDRHNIYGERAESQLSKYYEAITNDKEYSGKEPHAFIFSPDYNQIDLRRFSCGEKYKIIYYSEIYRFFVENKNEFDDMAYFGDFLNAMYKHTKPYDNDLEEEMQRRFLNAIYNAKEQQNI